MANAEYDEYDDNDSDLPKKLRAVIKELRKENSDLQSKYESLNTESRTRVLGDAIRDRGLSPKIAALVPKDIDNDALDAWLDEYGDVFGTAAPASQQDPNAAVAAATRRIADAQAGAVSTPTGDILAAIEGAADMDELMQVLKGY